MANKKRRLCSYCHKKRYIDKMVIVHYPLIKKVAFHCIECFESFENLHEHRYLKKMSPRDDNY